MQRPHTPLPPFIRLLQLRIPSLCLSHPGARSQTTGDPSALIVQLCSVAQLYPTLCSPMDCSPPGSSVHGDSPGKNTGVGFHALFQGIFPTQGSNPGLLHGRQILYHLSHQGSHREVPSGSLRNLGDKGVGFQYGDSFQKCG